MRCVYRCGLYLKTVPDKENDQESVEDQQNVAADESDGSNEPVYGKDEESNSHKEDDLPHLAEDHDVIPEVKSKCSHPVQCPYFAEVRPINI